MTRLGEATCACSDVTHESSPCSRLMTNVWKWPSHRLGVNHVRPAPQTTMFCQQSPERMLHHLKPNEVTECRVHLTTPPCSDSRLSLDMVFSCCLPPQFATGANEINVPWGDGGLARRSGRIQASEKGLQELINAGLSSEPLPARPKMAWPDGPKAGTV